MSERHVRRADMGPPRRTFIERVLAGEALASEIDAWIERWHTGAVTDLELHEYLGMTWEEYQHYGADEGRLSAILSARRRRVTLAEATAVYETGSLAAGDEPAARQDGIEHSPTEEGLTEP